MDSIFIIQIISAFVVGGLFVSFLSFWAERASKASSGLILAFPSTLTLGLLFLGWSSSPQKVAEAIPTSIFAFGVSLLFIVFYITVAIKIRKIIRPKILSIPFSFFLSTAMWFLLVSFAIKWSGYINFITASLIYFACLYLSSYFLRQHKEPVRRIVAVYSGWQKMLRILFIGLILVAVVIANRLFTHLWGGALSMFPTAFSSTLIVYHWYYRPRDIPTFFWEVPIGSLSIYIYAVVAIFAFPFWGILLGTVVANIASLAVSITLVNLNKKYKYK